MAPSMFNMPPQASIATTNMTRRLLLPLSALPQGKERIPFSNLLGEPGAQQSEV